MLELCHAKAIALAGEGESRKEIKKGGKVWQRCEPGVTVLLIGFEWIK